MTPYQQLLMLLSGSSGLSGQPNAGGMMASPMASPMAAPQASNQMRLTGGLNAGQKMAPSPQMQSQYGVGDDWDHGGKPGFYTGDPGDNGDNGHNGDTGGDGHRKGDDVPDLTALMQQWRNAVDQGPGGYTNAMRQNLGMGGSPYSLGNQSGMASFMDLFMGKNANRGNNNGGPGRDIGGPGSEGPGFRWLGGHNGGNGGGGNNGGGSMHPLQPISPLGPNIGRVPTPRDIGGPGSEGTGFRWLGGSNNGRQA
jgi:hypothetical protein